MNPFQLNIQAKNYYLLIIGQFVSQFGSKLTSFGLILWSYKQSGSVLSMSLLSVCYLVPEVMLSFISGTISDKWNKKKIMLVSDAIAAFFSCCVLVMLFTGTLRVEYLYLINFFLGVTDSFQFPASSVAISLIVPKEDYMKISGINSFFTSFIGIFAPIVATSLYAFFGLRVLVMIDLVTFLFAFLTLAFGVHIPDHATEEREKKSIFSECIYGIRYLITKKDVFSLVLFMGFVNLVAAVYNTDLAPMILLRNGNNDVQLGVVSSAISVAGLVGSIFVSKMPAPKKRISLILNIMTFSFLFCNGLLGIGQNYYVWTLAVFGGNVLIPFLTANVEYIMRTNIPIELQGRVFAARNTLQYTSIPIGNLLGGILADDVFIPYIRSSSLKPFWKVLVGTGDGAGLGLLYICFAIIGSLGTTLFRMSKSLQLLNGPDQQTLPDQEALLKEE
jgi:MFS family permease